MYLGVNVEGLEAYLEPTVSEWCFMRTLAPLKIIWI